MVLINNLTVDEINAALLHLQRSQNEVVGGEKGTTIQNITITNQGGGSGAAGQDWSVIINALENRINANEQTDNAQAEQIAGIMEQLMSLSANGITNLQFDATNRYLIIYTEDGNTYDVQITSEPITMTLDSTTNKLTLVMGSQTQEVTLPYINANQKGVAGGVATLDENGRVPYSQLPESAMEFKGEWNASTNTPTLADGVGTNGDFYVCNVGGTVNFGTQAEPREVTFAPNDRVIYNGDTDLWIKLPAGQVASVNGQSGVVELDADDIPYNSTLSVKDKLDSATQSDWTETDSAEPSFIKHKIPIWITQGSASDNMAPVDAVTDGEMRPVTSNAAYKAINGVALNKSGVAGNYFLLAEADISSSSVPNLSADIYFFYRTNQYNVGMAHIDITFKSTQTSTRILGWTDLNLNNPNTNYPSLIITESGDKQYLYIQSVDSYFSANIKVQKYDTTKVTIYDTQTEPSSLTGTVVYNSRTDLTSSVHTRENHSYVGGEIETGEIYLDGKPIYRYTTTWTINNLPVGNSSYTWSASHWSNIDTIVNIRVIRPKSTGLLNAIVCASYRFDPATKTFNVYNNQTDWTGPFVIIFEYTKP